MKYLKVLTSRDVTARTVQAFCNCTDAIVVVRRSYFRALEWLPNDWFTVMDLEQLLQSQLGIWEFDPMI